MINVLFQATKGDGEKEDFWSQKGKSLLEAITFLLFEESEYNAKIDEKTGKIIPETRDFSHLIVNDIIKILIMKKIKGT